MNLQINEPFTVKLMQIAPPKSIGQPVISAPNATTCVCQQPMFPNHSIGHQPIVIPLSM